MKTLRDFIAETEKSKSGPLPGDNFAFEFDEDLVIESYVVDVTDDAIVVAADPKTMKLLEGQGCKMETIRRYGAVGSSAGKGYTLEQTRIDSTESIQRIMELSGLDPKIKEDEGQGQLLTKTLELEPTGPTSGELDESVMSEIDIDLRHIAKTESFDALQDAVSGQFGSATKRYLENLMMEVARENRLHYDDDIDEVMELVMDRIVDMYPGDLDEAEYQGRKVQLNKPMQGDIKKFKVYVKDPKTGNVKKVNFGHGGKSARRAGQKTLSIKKSNPARRRSFRARHNCDNPGPKTKARYWSCRKW